MKKFQYVGEGLGVPGLPHEVTDEDAKRDGLEALLAEAIKNGSYVEVKAAAPEKRPATKEVSNG